jgi:hypothetical protein
MISSLGIMPQLDQQSGQGASQRASRGWNNATLFDQQGGQGFRGAGRKRERPEMCESATSSQNGVRCDRSYASMRLRNSRRRLLRSECGRSKRESKPSPKIRRKGTPQLAPSFMSQVASKRHDVPRAGPLWQPPEPADHRVRHRQE